MAGELIPPAVIDIVAQATDALAKIGEVKTALADLAKKDTTTRIDASVKGFEAKLATVNSQLGTFAKKTTNTNLGGDAEPFERKLTLVKQQLLEFSREVRNAKLGADAAPFWAQIAKLRTELAAMSPLDIRIDPKLSATSATIQGLKGDLASALTGSIIAAAAGGDKRGGGGGAGLAGFLSAFLTPKVGAFGHVGGALGAGLDIAGLSVTHMAVAGLDLAGSATAALGGGILKALSGGGVLAVGMGSNMLVGSSTMADIKSMYSLMNPAPGGGLAPVNNYATAMKMLHLPVDAGTKAEWGQAQALTQLNNYWDTATSTARVAATKLYASFESAAKPFISLIASAATTNFTNLTKDLKPFFTWLDSMGTKKNPGGLRIFKELESIFASHTATGASAFINAFESLAKIIAYVAPKTGGFLQGLNRFFTGLNTALSNPQSKKGKHAYSVINTLLAEWKAWYGFFKQLISDAYALFSNGKDQHTGLAIIQELTGFLKQFHAFETSMAGTSDIKNLFSASKGEITAFLQIIPALVKGFGSIFLALAPSGHRGGTDLVKGIVAAVNGIFSALGALARGLAKIPGINKIAGTAAQLAAFGLGLGVLANKLGLLKLGHIKTLIDTLGRLGGKRIATALTGVASIVGKIPLIGSKLSSWISTIAGKLGQQSPQATFATAVGDFQAAVAEFAASVRVPGGGVPTAVGGGAAAGEGGAAAAAATAGETAAGGALGALALAAAVAAAPLIIGKMTGAKYNPQQALVAAYIAQQQKKNPLAFASAGRGGNPIVTHAMDVTGTGKGQQNASKTLEQYFGLSPKQVSAFYDSIVKQAHKDNPKLKSAAHHAAKDYADGFSHGVTKHTGDATKSVKDMADKVNKAFKKHTGSHSPSTITRQVAFDYVRGFVLGLTKNGPEPVRELTRQTADWQKILKKELPKWRTDGVLFVKRLSAGITSEQKLPVADITNISQQMVKAVQAQYRAFYNVGNGAAMQIAAGVRGAEPEIAAAVQQAVSMAVSGAVTSAVSGAIASARSQILTSTRAGAGTVY